MLTSLDQLRLIMQALYTLLQTSYINEEVSGTEPSLSVSVPFCDIVQQRCLSVISEKQNKNLVWSINFLSHTCSQITDWDESG